MKRLLAILVFVALVVPSGTAGAASSYAFRGGGWGHGVGASQYGALGLAQKGWTVEAMLLQYYAGTSLQTLDPPSTKVRVGLLQNRDKVTLTAHGGPFDLTLSNGGLIETVPQGESRKIKVSGSKYMIKKGSTVIASGVGGGSNHLRAVRSGEGSKIRISEWFDRRMGRGFLEFRIAGSTRAHLVGVVPFEQYLYGIAEVPFSWPDKVQRFQAILARTYAYEKINRTGNNRSGCDCGLYATTADQHYTGWENEAASLGHVWVAAVDDTAKRVVTYGGAPIQAVYSSSSGGMSDSSAVVWGGTFPYLKKRCDPGDYTSSNPNRTWSLTLNDTDAASRLRSRLGWNIARVTKIKVLSRGGGGHIRSAKVKGTSSSGGDVAFTTSGDGLRIGLSLKSSRVWINAKRQVKGAIRNHYDDLNCKPGLAKSNLKGANGGKWQRFAKGRIYHKSGPGTHWIFGPTLGKYLDLNGPKGRLGYPTAGVERISDGRDRVFFEGGRIVCTRSTKACTVTYT